jgi:CheY-like chemotaxis protein
MKLNLPILLVEDNPDDVFMIKRALKAANVSNPLQVAEDGRQAMQYLSAANAENPYSRQPMPGLVILDLKLPHKTGLEVLEWIRDQPELRTLLVIILSSSREPQDVDCAYRLRANSFLVKPAAINRLVDMARTIKSYWLEHNVLPSIIEEN